MTKFLSDLISKVSANIYGNPNGIKIGNIEYDSRKADVESLFFCLPGAKADGHDYARNAYFNKCRAFVVERRLDLPSDAVQIVVQSSRESLAVISAEFFSRPAEKLTLIGITGTKGKTTTAILIEKIMLSCGIKCAYIGSNGVQIGDKHYDTVNTTPESRELQRFFSMIVEENFTHVVMEVSSQSLDHYRIRGLEFDSVIYTNLGHDHISNVEHATFEEYRDAKRKLFTDYGAKKIIYNRDDANHSYMIKGSTADLIGFSIEHDSSFRASNIKSYRDETSLGIEFDVNYRGIKTGVRLRTPGNFSVYNGLAAIAVCSCYGITPRQSSDALRTISIQGRFEIVDAIPGITFIIDYAHNGLSLTHALSVLREYNPKRLICVFGCIGNRSQIRRRELAEAASELADFTVITSDNPDNEEPEVIIEDVLRWFDKTKPYTTIADREEAIRFAVRIADEGDIVLFAGKGHEDYQIIGGVKVPFCERDIILSEAAKVAEKV